MFVALYMYVFDQLKRTHSEDLREKNWFEPFVVDSVVVLQCSCKLSEYFSAVSTINK